MVVVGAGASGLAVAASLQERGRRALVLERDDRVGSTWARRYDRLHLHTVRRFSGLPFHAVPRRHRRYVAKDDYARYLADYAGRLGLDVRTGAEVERIRRDGDDWVVELAGDELRPRVVVVATGRHRDPVLPTWPGASTFSGTLLHSSEFTSGRPFAGQRVLVVGLGNSGAEIATDVLEHGARSVAVAVRTVPPITTRQIAGVPVQLFGMLLYPLPARAVDRAGAVLRRLGTGDLRPWGLGQEEWGPFTARRPPVIDVGFLKQLKAGRVSVLPAVTALTSGGAVFDDGLERSFESVIAATGFTTGLDVLLDVPHAVDDRGLPRHGAHRGLYFAGYAETPRGQLFESNRASRRLAVTIDRELAAPA